MDKLQDFAGNAAVKAAVDGMLRTGRIPHAVILEGDAGLGKRTLADFIARAAVCAASPGKIPCGICGNCHLAVGENHPDIAYIQPVGRTLSVDTVRQVRQDAFILPHQAPRRVFIFAEADAMTEQAQNALLKVLEEPPAYVVFLLLTVNAARLLATIRSRSVILTLSSPGLDEGEACAARLLADGRAEGADVSPTRIRWALKEENGNIGRALALLQAGENSAEEQTAAALLQLAASGSDLELLTAALPMEKDRKGAHIILESLLVNIQGALARKAAGQADGRDKTAGGGRLDSRADDPGQRLSMAGLARMEEAVRTALRGLERNANLPLLSTYLCACFKEAAGL